MIHKLNLLGWTQTEIGEKTGLTQQAVSHITNNTDFGKICIELQTFLSQGKSMDWIADIRARQMAGRDCLIHKLSLLGWAQTEIGEKVGLSQNRVSEIIGNTDFGKIDTEIQTFLSQGKTMERIRLVASFCHF